MFKKKCCYSAGALLVIVLLVMAAAMPQAAQAVGYGDVYSFGRNSQGQLGHGDTESRHMPAKIEGLGPVRSVGVANFGYYSLVVLANGDVYSFGMNSYGVLGHGDTEARHVPAKIEGLGPAKAVDAGGSHSMVLLENGDVYTFGMRAAMLGHSPTGPPYIPVPTKVEGIGPVQAISAGSSHSMVLLENGDVYAFGSNGRGRLGLGEGASTTMVPVKIEGLPPVKEVSAGYDHSLVLTTTGEVYAFGTNDDGQLGLGDTENRSSPTRIPGIGPALKIAAGRSFSLVLLENGDVYSFGRNNHGQLGHGEMTARFATVTTPAKIEGLEKAQALSAGMEHSLVLLENGDVYGFGRNGWGELGWDPDLGRHPAPGYNPTPAKIEGVDEAQVISTGYNYSLVLVEVEREITITIDNQLLYSDVPPIILHGRTMVPLRAIFEALDVEVEWIAETRTIIGTTDDTRIELTIDSTETLVNGVEGTLDVPATIIEGRTLVPVRFIAESTGQNVGWDADARRVIITTR